MGPSCFCSSIKTGIRSDSILLTIKGAGHENVQVNVRKCGRSAVHNIHNPSFFLFASTFHIFLHSAKWNWEKKNKTKTNKQKKNKTKQKDWLYSNENPQLFVSIYLWQSPRDRNQNRSSSFFSKNEFHQAKEIPGMPSSITITVSFTVLLNDAIF